MLIITLKSAGELSESDIRCLYDLALRTGFLLEAGYLEKAHFEHNPTVVMAHWGEQLVGFQSYNTYRIKTPFFRRRVPFIYGGLAFQDNAVAGRGLGYRISRYYMQRTLGRLFFLKQYAFAIRTPTPRLMQILGVQHQLVHYKNGLLTPDVLQFALQFVRTVRRFSDPVNDRLVVLGKPLHVDITAQWPRLFRAADDAYNQLAYETGLILAESDRQFITGSYLILLGYSSWQRLIRSVLRA